MADTNYSTTTTLAAAIPAGIAPRALYYYDKANLFWSLTKDWHYNVPDGQGSIKLRQLDTLTPIANTQGAAGSSESFTWQNTDGGTAGDGRNVTPLVHTTSVRLAVEALGGSPTNLFDDMGRAWGTARAKYIDSVATYGFAAKYTEAPSTGPAHEIGTNGTQLRGSIGRTGYALLKDAGVMGPIHWVVSPTQANELLSDTEVAVPLRTNGANKLGIAGIYGINPDRYIGQFDNIYIWQADEVVSSTGFHSIMFGQGALAYVSKNFPSSYTGGEASDNLIRVQELTDGGIGLRVLFGMWFATSGIPFSATTNSFMVDIVS